MRLQIGTSQRGPFASRLIVTFGIMVAIQACGADERREDHRSMLGDDGASDTAVVPKEYEDSLSEQTAELGLANGTQTLWINFDGASVSKGNNPGQSFIPCRSVAKIPSVNMSSTRRAAVVGLVQAHFAKAGAQLAVTTQKPASGVYSTIHVGGTYRGSLGCSGSPYGIAPFPSRPQMGHIGFIFSNGSEADIVMAQGIAHEFGHTLHQDHKAERTDVMYPSVMGLQTAFKRGKIYNSAKIQNSPAELTDFLGAYVK